MIFRYLKAKSEIWETLTYSRFYCCGGESVVLVNNNNQFFVILVLHTHTQDPSISISQCAKGFVILSEFTELNTTKGGK